MTPLLGNPPSTPCYNLSSSSQHLRAILQQPNGVVSMGSSRSSSARPKRDLPPGTPTLTVSGSRDQSSSTQESRTEPRVDSSSNYKRTRRSSGRSTPSKRWSTRWRSKPWLWPLTSNTSRNSRRTIKGTKKDNQDNGYPSPHVVCY